MGQADGGGREGREAGRSSGGRGASVSRGEGDTPELTHYADAEFWGYYEELPKHIQEQADKKYELLEANPDHPSLNFGPVVKSNGVYSARVNLQYRALALRVEPGTYDWFWIGDHEDYERLIDQLR